MNADDDTLAEYLAQALADQEAGLPLDLAALCGDRPDLVPAVAAALGLSSDLPALHRTSLATDAAVTGTLAGRYTLQAAIGRGASGTVYRARDERLQREVAVKLLHRGLFASDEAEARFQREAVALAAHEHAHIVRVHDQGQTEDGTTFLVTELLRGLPLQAVLDAAIEALPCGPSAQAFAGIDWLRDLLPDARLEASWLRQIVAWMADLGDGLAAAHAQGLCHRDVKPGNAFVTSEGRIVLLDFGIAARAGDAALTRDQAVIGTPCYMAPEQARGNHEPHPALDVYGLGATLYHLLTHRPPHQGDLQQVLVALRLEDPKPAPSLHRGLPRDLRAILDHALAKQPAHRYPTMLAMVADLRAFLAHLPIAVRPLGPVRRLVRHALRRPARTTAIAVSVLAAGALFAAISGWAGLSQVERRQEHFRQQARLPADLCIEGHPDKRALVPLAERLAMLAELDQVLELDRDDIGIRLLRAASFLDHGDLAAARSDLDAIAAHADSPYLRELAHRYGAASKDARGLLRLDQANLPEPTTTQDCFVAGFHALRDRDCERADELLTRAADFPPARDLRLLAILGRKKTEPDRAIAEANALEGLYGQPTARTQHALAAAMLQRREWEKALPYAQESLRLRPDRHGPWNNLALAHLRLGHREEALRCYQRAVELRPWFENSMSGLCQTLRELGRYDEARAAAARIEDVGWREHELGHLELQLAIQALTQGETERRVTAAEGAIAHFDAATKDTTTRNPAIGSIPAVLQLARSLLGDDADAALPPFLLQLRRDPRNPRLISNLAAMLAAASLDADDVARLRLWLLDLAIDLDPNQPDHQIARQRLIESLRPPR
ncbi:MAG: serine/threonine-protein kinase [Planctomycetota bacterium]